MQLLRPEFILSVNAGEEQVDDNIRFNLLELRDQWQSRPCIILGGGPSAVAEEVNATWAKLGCPIFALNDAAHGIGCMAPDFVVMMDARMENVSLRCVQKPSDSMYLLASQVHPSVYRALNAQGVRIKQWHAAGPDELKAQDVRGVGGGVTILTRVIPMAYEMGFRQFHLFGVDSSHADGKHHGYSQPLNDNPKEVDFFTPIKTTKFRSTGGLASQAEQCMEQWLGFEKFGCEFHINGEGLLPTMWRESKEYRADADGYEPEKYRRMWDNPDYRRWSPGETQMPRILEALQPPMGSQFYDFGCGTGRAAAKLVGLGHYVTGVDFAANCLDPALTTLPEGRFEFVEHCLWKPLSGVKPRRGGVYGVCTDVMEHIPPDKVDAVLSNIAAFAERVAFTISFKADNFGLSIGEKLHLTVRPSRWWLAKLKQHFTTVEYLEDGLFVATNEAKNADATNDK